MMVVAMLARPLVVGPVSTLSQRVRVVGQLTGATVTVHALGIDDRVVAAGVTDSADHRIALLPGESLRAGDILHATQEYDGDASPLPLNGDPLGTEVQPVLAVGTALGEVSLRSVPFTCGRAAWLIGGVPGARARLRSGGSDLGTGVFEDTEGARLTVDPLLAGSFQISQAATGLGSGAPTTRTAVPLAGSSGEPLDHPVIDPPPVACNRAVRVVGVVDGAEVTLVRDDGVSSTEQRHFFDASALWVPLDRPLVEGERLTVSQAVHPECQRSSDENRVRVGAAPPIPRPTVDGPLCAGSTVVAVSGLIPGAGVEVRANGTVYRAEVPVTADRLLVLVEPLEAAPSGQVVTARQEQCGKFGPASEAVPVDPAEADPPQHRIEPEPLACSPVVVVEGAHPGAVLTARSATLGPISGHVLTDQDGRAVIPVAPQLRDGDQIEVLQFACGNSPVSADAPVGFLEWVPVPWVGETFVGRQSVEIGDVVPGATVEVHVTGDRGQLRGTAVVVADRDPLMVGLGPALEVGDEVAARQGLCSSLSGFSAPSKAGFQPINADWWIWEGANARNEVWDEDYVLGGRFRNRGGTAIADLEVKITEELRGPGTTLPPSPAGDGGAPVVAPGAEVVVRSEVQHKDWVWFTEVIWYVKGPTHREYWYRAELVGVDGAGDPYPTVTSVPLRVFVNVPKWKRAAAAAAMGAAASAAAMAASIVLIVAAGAAYAAAAISGAVALDPPEPDPDFRRSVTLPGLVPVPPGIPGETLAGVFRLIEQVMAIELTKSLIEGKRLGALREHDELWAARLATARLDASDQQRALVTEARAVVEDGLAEALAALPPDLDLVEARHRLLYDGLPDETASLGLDPETLAAFDAMVRTAARPGDRRSGAGRLGGRRRCRRRGDGRTGR